MNQTQTSLTETMDYLSDLRKRNVRRLTVVRTLWIGLILNILLFYLDAVAILSGNQRMVLGMALLIVLAAIFVLSPMFLNRTKCREKMLARMIESNHPDMDNVLVNAIDFNQSLHDRKVQNVSVPLMQKEINLAVRKFAKMETVEGLELPTMKFESRILKGALAIWLLCAIIFYNWFFSEVPRFFDPFGDHPPYNSTQFVVEPAGAIIDYGQDLTINVTTKRKIPENVSLVFRNPEGEFLNEVGMFSSGQGQFSQTIEDIRTEMVFCASIKRGRSKYYKIDLSKTPRIEQVLASYKFPEYTGIPGKNAVLTDEESKLRGYEGTQITMTVQSNRPLEGGTVTIGDKQYKCESDGENIVKADFPLLENSKFSVALMDIEGNSSTDKFTGNIEIVPDGEPYVTIVNPGMNSFAIPTAIVPIIIEAYDDLGVQNVSIFRSHNDSDDARKVLSEPNQTGEFIRVVETLDLGDLGLKPGDIIDYYATATDSQPIAPQTAASESFKLEIISEKEYSQSMQERMNAEELRLKYENILAQIEELIEIQKELEQQTSELKEEIADGADPNSQELQDRLNELAKKQSELSERTQEVSKKLTEESETPPVFDIEKDYKEALAEFAKRLDSAGEHMDTSADKISESADSPDSPGGNIGSLAIAGDEQKKALEEMGERTQDLRDAIRQVNNEIAKMYDLMKDVNTFKELYLAQKNLARQTKSLSQIQEPDFDTQIRFKELAEDEAWIKGELENLKEQFREHAAEVKEEYPDVAEDAEAIAKEIEIRQIPEIMQEGENFLNQANGPNAHPRVQEAYEQMHAMIAFCEACAGGGCEQCAFRLKLMMMNLGNTMAQLSQGFGLGLGMGSGFMGAFGRGAAGFGGGYSEYAMFGGDTFGRNHLRESSVISARPKNMYTDMIHKNNLGNQLSGNIEELSSQEETETEFEIEGQNRMMVEYNRLIEAYFQRLAEDK